MKKKIYRKSFLATLPDGSKKKVVFSSTKSEKDAARKRDAAKAQYLAGLEAAPTLAPEAPSAEN